MTRETETAVRMLRRYSTPQKAAEMAWLHACDYREGTPMRDYWRTVADRILELSRVRVRCNHVCAS